jgi:hypothetical protein
MRNRVIFFCIVAFVISLFSVNLVAQVVPKSIREGGSDAALRDKKNAWTVGIVGGLLSGSYMRLVDEMASVLNDGDNLRVLPIVSYGAASNLDDLLYLRGVVGRRHAAANTSPAAAKTAAANRLRHLHKQSTKCAGERRRPGRIVSQISSMGGARASLA